MLTEIIEQKKKNLQECIGLALDSLMDKLFDKEQNNNGIFKDFTSIFKTGILFEKILKQSSVILKNLSNLSPAVLERFNDLFNYMPKLSLNEDFCNSFTGKMKNGKEINNFSKNFRLIAISTLGGIRNLSDAAKSRFSIIYTSEYNDSEKEIATKLFESKTPGELSFFIEKYEKIFNIKLPFLEIIKILSIFRKFYEVREEQKDMNIMFSIYFALYLNFETKIKKQKFLNILKDVNPKFDEKIKEMELNNDNKNELNEIPDNPFISDSSRNILKSK